MITVFKALMATRAYMVLLRHVEALNTIDLEIRAHRPREKAVLDVWPQYLDHPGAKSMEPGIWALRRNDLLVDLLYAMGMLLACNSTKLRSKMARTPQQRTASQRKSKGESESSLLRYWKVADHLACGW